MKKMSSNLRLLSINIVSVWLCLFHLSSAVFSSESLINRPIYTIPLDEPVHIYLLRGLGRESGHWGNTFLESIKCKVPNSTITLLDLPGAGMYFEQTAFTSISKMSQFLHIHHYFQLQKPGKHILLATSLAGIVAIDWIHQYPNDFDGITLVGSSFKEVCSPKDRVQPEARKMFKQIFFTEDLLEREQLFVEINSNKLTDNDSLLTAWINLQNRHPVSKQTLARQTVAGMIYRSPNHIPNIPVLVIGSKADKIVSFACICAVSEYLNASMKVHDTAGHGIPIDAPLWLSHSFITWIEDEVFDRETEPEMVLLYREPGLTQKMSSLVKESAYQVKTGILTGTEHLVSLFKGI